MLALTVAPAQAASPSKDRQVIAFFLKHPRLAQTRAGQRELWKVLAHVSAQLRTLQIERARPKSNEEEARLAIEKVFGVYAEQAMGVSGCETGQTWDPRASNGQYLGIFQMGSGERARYGHGSSWLEQAAAAYRYFVASGRDWSPWECRWAAWR